MHLHNFFCGLFSLLVHICCGNSFRSLGPIMDAEKNGDSCTLCLGLYIREFLAVMVLDFPLL